MTLLNGATAYSLRTGEQVSSLIVYDIAQRCSNHSLKRAGVIVNSVFTTLWVGDSVFLGKSDHNLAIWSPILNFFFQVES